MLVLAVSDQLSAFSYQRSAFSDQRSTFSYQLPISDQLSPPPLAGEGPGVRGSNRNAPAPSRRERARGLGCPERMTGTRNNPQRRLRVRTPGREARSSNHPIAQPPIWNL